MSFSIRLLKESDYETLCQWWKAWRWEPPLKDFLPENGTGGLMVSKNGVNIVAGFIYFTNSKVCWSEFIISDFNYKNKVDRKEAINILIFELCELARAKGYKYIYTVVKNENLENAYKEMGFLNGSVKAQEMVMIL
jgi:hypothetical protein